VPSYLSLQNLEDQLGDVRRSSIRRLVLDTVRFWTSILSHSVNRRVDLDITSGKVS
jgi:hypothetical protein